MKNYVKCSHFDPLHLDAPSFCRLVKNSLRSPLYKEILARHRNLTCMELEILSRSLRIS